MEKLKHFSILFLIFITISSCSTKEPETEVLGAYPVDGDSEVIIDPEIYSMDSGYPVGELTTQSHSLPDDLVIPTPSNGTAVIHGVLISLSEDNTPYIAPALYLGTLLTSNSDNGNGVYLGSISIDDDPEGQQASNGKFVFTDIPPGNYGLFIWTPVNAFIIKDERTTEPIILEVNADETYDLGKIFVP